MFLQTIEQLDTTQVEVIAIDLPLGRRAGPHFPGRTSVIASPRRSRPFAARSDKETR
jgi:hypothetical protein